MKYNYGCVLLLLLTLTGCSTPNYLPLSNSLSSSTGNMVVIGQFELTPALIPELEQKTYWNAPDEGFLNSVLVATGRDKTPLSKPIKSNEWQATIKTELGQPFMVDIQHQRTWLRGAMVLLDAMKQEYLWFPGGLYFEAPETAKAVYIGTLQYHRDDFNRIVDIKVIDEYQKTLATLGLTAQQDQIAKSLLRFETAQKPLLITLLQ